MLSGLNIATCLRGTPTNRPYLQRLGTARDVLDPMLQRLRILVVRTILSLFHKGRARAHAAPFVLGGALASAARVPQQMHAEHARAAKQRRRRLRRKDASARAHARPHRRGSERHALCLGSSRHGPRAASAAPPRGTQPARPKAATVRRRWLSCARIQQSRPSRHHTSMHAGSRMDTAQRRQNKRVVRGKDRTARATRPPLLTAYCRRNAQNHSPALL